VVGSVIVAIGRASGFLALGAFNQGDPERPRNSSIFLQEDEACPTIRVHAALSRRTMEDPDFMTPTAVTPSPGFISITVSDVVRSAAFYETYLGGVRDTFDFGPGSAVFVGWPTVALSGRARTGPARSTRRDLPDPGLVAGIRRAGAP
jgi:hypothetical protein